jgi:hypothetical protein
LEGSDAPLAAVSPDYGRKPAAQVRRSASLLMTQTGPERLHRRGTPSKALQRKPTSLAARQHGKETSCHGGAIEVTRRYAG